MKKFPAFFLASLLLPSTAFCAGGAGTFPGLGAAEAARLEKGEALIRTVDGFRNLAIPQDRTWSKSLASDLSRLNPNYLTEVLALIPAGDKDQAPQRLNAALAKVDGFVRIVYHSERWKKDFPLFDSVRIDSRAANAAGETVEATVEMRPLDAFRARYARSASEEAIAFSCENLTPILYKGVKAVSPGDMSWRLYLYRMGDFYVFYGVGGIKAFDMFGALRDRLEPSFLGRTEAFFSQMLKETRG